VGAWLGALRGESGLPSALIASIDDGPFGPAHLRQLADALVAAKYDNETRAPGYSLPHGALRNLFLVPVILAHGFARLLPAPKTRSKIPN
jgi:ADP-ribosyl-[dinitrogen reductase] hydrolase